MPFTEKKVKGYFYGFKTCFFKTAYESINILNCIFVRKCDALFFVYNVQKNYMSDLLLHTE